MYYSDMQINNIECKIASSDLVEEDRLPKIIRIDTTKLEVGVRLIVKFEDAGWFPGTIEKKLDDQVKYRILFDDGQREDAEIKECPSAEFQITKNTPFSNRVWKTVLNYNRQTSQVIRDHEERKEKILKNVTSLPKDVQQWYWEVVWVKQSGFPWWPAIVVVRVVI